MNTTNINKNTATIKEQLNNLYLILSAQGLHAYINNINQLKDLVNNLQALNNINTPTYCKATYYTLSEAIETIEFQELEDNIECTLNHLQTKILENKDLLLNYYK